MKVLSTRLAMRDGYLPEQFRRTIVEWLKAGPPSKDVGERYESEEITTKPTVLKAGYCTLETFILKRPDATYEACRLTHIYREQTWVTEVILKTTPQSENKVYINIDCLGDTTGFDEIPTVRTEIIRAFVRDGWIREDILPISVEPITSPRGELCNKPRLVAACSLSRLRLLFPKNFGLRPAIFGSPVYATLLLGLKGSIFIHETQTEDKGASCALSSCIGIRSFTF